MKNYDQVLTRWVALAQGSFYAGTGIWPLLHMPSFVAITGPKVDLWLVRTVALLLTATGITLLLARWRHEIVGPVVFLAVANCTALIAIDLVYGGRVISPIYFLDAVAELALVVLWGLSMQLEKK